MYSSEKETQINTFSESPAAPLGIATHRTPNRTYLQVISCRNPGCQKCNTEIEKNESFLPALLCKEGEKQQPDSNTEGNLIALRKSDFVLP